MAGPLVAGCSIASEAPHSPQKIFLFRCLFPCSCYLNLASCFATRQHCVRTAGVLYCRWPAGCRLRKCVRVLVCQAPPTWKRTRYWSSGRRTTHMLHPMTPCEGPAGLFSGILPRKKNQPLDLLMSRPLMPSPLTRSVNSGCQSPKTPPGSCNPQIPERGKGLCLVFSRCGFYLLCGDNSH